jgi:hypothetical protein
LNLPLYRAIRISFQDFLDASNNLVSLIVAPAFSYRPSLRLVIIALLLGRNLAAWPVWLDVSIWNQN